MKCKGCGLELLGFVTCQGCGFHNGGGLRSESGDYMNQTMMFANELDALINRTRHEYDLEYAQVVGVLMMKAYLLMGDAEKQRDAE